MVKIIAIHSPFKCLVWVACLWIKMPMPMGRNEGGRVATPTSFSISDSFDMKILWFKFHCDIFTFLKMPRLWGLQFHLMKQLKKQAMTKYKLQALHVISIRKMGNVNNHWNFPQRQFYPCCIFWFDPPIELLYNRIGINMHSAPYKDGTGSVSHQK